MTHYFRPSPSTPRIYLYRDPVDFRKSYRGLAAIVDKELEHNPFDGALYVFINRRRDKIKLLFWEDNGFVRYYKSLAEEKFGWPRAEDQVMPLSGKQINGLLSGLDIGLMKGQKLLHYKLLF
ncbi:MAG: IS66 family insertion sequence element accessory protein TnpB [Candidatus Thiodiazotropha sp.]